MLTPTRCATCHQPIVRVDTFAAWPGDWETRSWCATRHVTILTGTYRHEVTHGHS
jgi:hypothetical protein